MSFKGAPSVYKSDLRQILRQIMKSAPTLFYRLKFFAPRECIKGIDKVVST